MYRLGKGGWNATMSAFWIDGLVLTLLCAVLFAMVAITPLWIFLERLCKPRWTFPITLAGAVGAASGLAGLVLCWSLQAVP